MRHRSRFWIVITGLLLLVAASRLTRLTDLTMNRDEVWSVWQTFGTPTQIILWTPYDWPPLYYLALAAWRSVASMYPAALRAFSTLMFPLGAVFLFRVMRRWRGQQAGLLVILTYAALGFGIMLSLEVRGYALLLALLPLALWLTVRYFDRPSERRALPLALALAAMFYTSLTSFGAFVMLGVFTLIVYRRAVWRWWLPGLIAVVLAAPEALAKSQVATTRVQATQTLVLPPLLQALARLFEDYAGFTFPVWVVLFLVVAALIIRRESRQWALIAALLVWVIGMPVVLYILNPVLGFFSTRYAWWIMPGIAMLIAWGLSYLPRAGAAIAGLVLAGMLFFPLPAGSPYQIWDQLSPLGDNFHWLRDHIQWGDVVLENRRNTCGAFEEWDYYLRAYFPNGLRFVTSPAGYRRVWVLNPHEQPDETRLELSAAYVPGRFVGPPGCLFRLYEAPPDVAGIPFENGMRFHGVDVMDGARAASGPLVRREGETVRLRLWWSVDYPPLLDYSVSTYLGRGNRIYDALDGPPSPYHPEDAPAATSRWQPGLYYIEERELTFPYPAAGDFDIRMAVYFWVDAMPVPAPGTDDNNHLHLARVRIRSY
jgi:hypothetical protein